MDSRIGLLDELRSGKASVSIVTTYSIDFAFYETVVLRRLNALGCDENLLLVDAERCGEALSDPDTRPRLAGLAYTLVPVARRGAFHPKLIALIGKKVARLWVGSHNMTFGGFGGNAEATSMIEAKSPAEAGLVADALDAIDGWLGEAGTGHARETVARARGLLGGAKPKPDVFFLHTGTARPPLWEQARPLLPERPRRVTLIGPFFDDRLQFIGRLQQDLAPREIIVAVDPEYVEIDASRAQRCGARFVDARAMLKGVGYGNAAPLHAKILLVETDDRRVLVCGSANPSAAAWLAPETNAEAILVQAGLDDEQLTRLGLAELQAAAEISATQWAEIGERVVATSEEPEERYVPALLASEDAGVVTVFGVHVSARALRLHLPGGDSLEIAATWADGTMTTQPEVDVSSCSLVEVVGGTGGFAVLNHVGTLAPKAGGGDARGQLNAALGALTEDAERLEEVLKIVERALDDDDADVRGSASADARRGTGESLGPEFGPRAIPLHEVRRRHSKPRSLASGNIAVVIDLLIRKIGEGLPAAPEKPPEVEEKDLELLDDVARDAPPRPVDGEALVRVCHRKVRRLVKRILKRIDLAAEIDTAASAGRAIVQLAAVLGVLRWLRRVEPQLSWLPRGQSLVPEDGRNDLLWGGATALVLARPTLGERLRAEVPEGCAEETVALGLLGWLGWESEVDASSLPRHPEPDELPWFHWTGLVIMLLAKVVADPVAVDGMRTAIRESRRRGFDRWLAEHVRIAEAVALAEIDPASASVLGRPARRGDVVRITMPNGAVSIAYVADADDTKVWVVDGEKEDGRPVQRSRTVAIRLAE